ncbi:vWA domain-containing protein [Marinigracilibium pacificum]|uniref:VWA domain-containing protein n=1 Tax=Marinigracilibium pacificum TaxID=2729599 RepID=A0A848J204_9BACT|nr:VWA domain-containing protein [Marinigracilibium pacificum]NMM50853.1 VWA domain-containing protein [Marinigracilibium pacificum]
MNNKLIHTSFNPLYLLILGVTVLFSSCKFDSPEPLSPHDYGPGGKPDYSGRITAGEWNDLDNWEFWNSLMNSSEYSSQPSYWNFYTNNRISVLVQNNGTPVVNAKVEILRNGTAIWSTITDNLGKAELWIGAFQNESPSDLNDFSLRVNNDIQNQDLLLYQDGVNTINLTNAIINPNRVELSFIVDATGSMSDELDFLKDDLKSVINTVETENNNIDIYTSTVFYRDQEEQYVTLKSDFTADINSTISFIQGQNAFGGGDYPEAVHTALDVAINDLQWSQVAKTRIAFLLLDAPPHYKPEVLNSIHETIKSAAEKGIKVIPITASGIDKETEFLMRFMAISTNGTYVFITNDSGVGNDHIDPTVGEYQVDLLNNLLIKLIKKYSN